MKTLQKLDRVRPLGLAVWLLLPTLMFAKSKDAALKATTDLLPHTNMVNYTNRLTVCDFDGLKTDYHYVERTNRTAIATLVFVHGYPASLFTWTEIIAPIPTSANYTNSEALAKKFNLLAMDLPGQGFTKQSRCGKRRQAILEAAGAGKSLVAFLDAKGLSEPVILVGHSWGALVALHAAKHASPLTPVGQPAPSNRAWSVAGIVLISPEGTPRTGPEHLPSERELREGLFGRLSAWHWCAGSFNWWFDPDSAGRRDAWEGAVEDAIKQLSTDRAENVPVSKHQKQAYGLLMRVKENYKTNRYLVRRDKSCDWPIIVWAGTSFPGERVVIWGAKDNLFPVPVHSSFVTNFFRPSTNLTNSSTSMKLIPSAAHITPEDAPKEISEFLLKAFGELRN